MNPEPLLNEEEPEEEKRDSGRRAYFAGDYKGRDPGGDTFGGAFRGVPAPKRGGQQTVKDEDTLGDEEHCWCGQNLGHQWPNKSRGASHPRGDEMSAMADDKPYINPRDLKSYDRKVVRAVCALVNEYGVDYRISGNNVILTPPNASHHDVAERIKISPARQPDNQVKFLEKWATKYVRPAKVDEAAAALAEKFNDPEKKPHEKKAPTPLQETTKRRSEASSAAHARKRAAQDPASVPKAPQIESSQASQPDAMEALDKTLDDIIQNEPPRGYHQHTFRDEDTLWWVSDARPLHYVCKYGDFEHDGEGFAHTSKHKMSEEEKRARVEVSILTADRDVKGRRARARSAIKFLADEYDIPLATDQAASKAKEERLGKQVVRLEKEVEKLKIERDALRVERDDLQAWKDLILEASR